METNDKKDLHKGHRKRLRKKFLEAGDFSGFYDHEILELLLNYSIKVKNTNEIAHKLIDKFHSLSGVFEARPEELMKVDGISDVSVALIKMQYELLRVYLTSKYDVKNKPYTTGELIPYLTGLFYGKKQEFLYLVCVDSKDRITKIRNVGKGINDLNLDFREIMAEIMAIDARGVILAHNHPNGILTPSQIDIEVTGIIKKELDRVQVDLIDHLIFVDNEHMSILNSHSFKFNKL